MFRHSHLCKSFGRTLILVSRIRIISLCAHSPSLSVTVTIKLSTFYRSKIACGEWRHVPISQFPAFGEPNRHQLDRAIGCVTLQMSPLLWMERHSLPFLSTPSVNRACNTGVRLSRTPHSQSLFSFSLSPSFFLVSLSFSLSSLISLSISFSFFLSLFLSLIHFIIH